MILKSIIGLILAIAVGALGVSSLGDGIFGFLDKSKAGKMVEDARELARIHAIYKADNRDGLNAFDKLTADAPSVTVANANATYYGLVEDELNTKDLVKRGFAASQGEFTYLELTVGDEGFYLINASAEISDEVCDKINEMVGFDAAATFPYTGTASVETDMLALANNTTEFFCAEDDTTAVNAFVYYLVR
jgi:hypothetical protein